MTIKNAHRYMQACTAGNLKHYWSLKYIPVITHKYVSVLALITQIF